MAALNELGIQPLTQPASEPSPNKQLAPSDVFPKLPPEVKGVPVIEWLAVGEPPAVRIEPGQYFPELEPLAKNLPEVLQSGLDVYKAQSGDTVFFNPVFISGEELALADQSGKLEQLVPPYGELSGSQPQEMSPEVFDRALMTAEDVQARLNGLTSPDDMEETLPTPTAAAAPPPAPGGPPAALQSRLANQRVKNLQPGAPTSGPQPGAGRLLAGILKKPV